MGYVYKITNTITNDSYVGIVLKEGKTIEDRFKEHVRQSNSGCVTILHAAIREFGEEKFTYCELASSDNDNTLLDLEIFFIQQLGTNLCLCGKGYNMTIGGQGTSGFKWSEESRKKKKIPCNIEKIVLEEELSTCTWSDLSVKYGVGIAALRSWACDMGLVKKRLKQKISNQYTASWSEEEKDRLLNLYDEGKSMKEIAEILNRTVGAVTVKFARIRKEKNITRRRFRNQHSKSFIIKEVWNRNR